MPGATWQGAAGWSTGAGVRGHCVRDLVGVPGSRLPACLHGCGVGGSLVGVSDAAHRHDEVPHGTSSLPRDLDAAQLAAAPVLASVGALVIEDLSVAEDDAFFAAIG